MLLAGLLILVVGAAGAAVTHVAGHPKLRNRFALMAALGPVIAVVVVVAIATDTSS